MKDFINELQQIEEDFKKGIYSLSEYSDLLSTLNQVLKNKKFV